MIIEFFAAIDVSCVPIPLGAHRKLTEVVSRQRDVIPLCLRSLEKGYQTVSVDLVVGRQPAYIDECWIDVLQRNRANHESAVHQSVVRHVILACLVSVLTQTLACSNSRVNSQPSGVVRW